MRVLALTLILFIQAVNGFACTCIKPNLKKLLRESEFVLIGRALNNLDQDSVMTKVLDSKGYGANVAFKIEKMLKGKTEKSTVAIIQNGSSCDNYFKLGDRYIIFVIRREQLYDSADVYSPIVKLESTDTRSDEDVMKYRRDDLSKSKLYERTLKKNYGSILNTNYCTSFHEESKIFKKYLKK